MKTLSLILLTVCIFTGRSMNGSELPILGIAHVAYQSSNLEQSRAFYTAFLGYEFAFAVSEESESWYLKINDDQFIKLVSTPGPTDDDRLVEVALQVSDIEFTFKQLQRRGLNPSKIETRSDGTLATTLNDPDNHLIAFVEYTPHARQTLARGKYLGARRVSTRLWHTGITVADEQNAKAFYESALGFREIWRGSRHDDGPTAWINVQMPGERGDYLEYMLVDGTPSRERLGSMHHMCFQTHDVKGAHREIQSFGLPVMNQYEIKMGRIQRLLFNLYDPDGTRSEFMESSSK